MFEIKRVRKTEKLTEGLSDKNIRKTTTTSILSFAISWAVGNFIVGLFLYEDFTKGLMLGVFAFVSGVLALSFLIPILGIILWIFGNFFWEWGIKLISILDIEVNWAVNVAWWLPSISFFVIGILMTLFIIVLISKLSKEKRKSLYKF